MIVVLVVHDVDKQYRYLYNVHSFIIVRMRLQDCLHVASGGTLQYGPDDYLG